MLENIAWFIGGGVCVAVVGAIAFAAWLSKTFRW